MNKILTVLAGILLMGALGTSELHAQRATRHGSHSSPSSFRGGEQVRYEYVNRRVWVPAHYRNVQRRVWVAGHFDQVIERVWIPARRVNRRVRRIDHHGHAYYVTVQEHVPGHFHNRTIRKFHPGHYEIRTVRELVPGRHEIKRVKVAVKVPRQPARRAGTGGAGHRHGNSHGRGRSGRGNSGRHN